MTMSVPLPEEFFGKVGKKYNSQSEKGERERGYGAKEAVSLGLTRRQSGDKFMTLGRRARVGNYKATSCEKWQKTTNAQQQQEHQIVQQTNNNRQNSNSNNNTESSVKIHYFPGRRKKVPAKNAAKIFC